ncbi:MAG: hypothetical protein Q8N05_06370 [Bacteroidota bacterium]|nr:hypothetical protein [Bacteroidota bacterium]
MSERIYSEVILKIGTKIFAAISSFDHSAAVNLIKTTNMNTPARGNTYRAGRIDEDISLEAIHDPQGALPTETDYWALRALIDSGAEVALFWGDVTIPGSASAAAGLINNLSFKASDDSTVNISAAFKITGGTQTTALV